MARMPRFASSRCIAKERRRRPTLLPTRQHCQVRLALELDGTCFDCADRVSRCGHSKEGELLRFHLGPVEGVRLLAGGGREAALPLQLLGKGADPVNEGPVQEGRAGVAGGVTGAKPACVLPPIVTRPRRSIESCPSNGLLAQALWTNVRQVCSCSSPTTNRYAISFSRR